MPEAENRSFRELAALRMSLGGLVWVLLAVTLIAFLLGLMEHRSCTDLRVEVTKPEPGTPRYAWCNRYDELYPWVLTFAPTATVGVVAAIARLRTLPTLVFAVALLIGALAFDAYPGKLDYVTPLTLLRAVL